MMFGHRVFVSVVKKLIKADSGLQCVKPKLVL